MAEPEDEPPKRRIYKGEQKTIKELAQNDARMIVVQAIDKCLPNTFAVVERIQASWKHGVREVQYLAPNAGYRRIFREVKETDILNVLTGRQGDKIRKEFEEYQRTRGIADMGRFVGSIGADPEVFVKDKDDNVIPSWLFLGSKKEPTEGGRSYYGTNHCYWDGWQAEFDVPAGPCIAYVTDGIRGGLLGIYRAAKKYDKNADLDIRSVVPVSRELLATGEEQHVEFGCMPSKNVYGLKGCGLPGREVPIRFAGGHIHFGCYDLPEKTLPSVVKALDAVLGVACVSLFDGFDNPVRREFYGLPGEYRTPPHGLEYRTLSNAWLMHPTVMNLVFDLSRRAFELGRTGLNALWNATEAETIECIGQSDVKKARALLERNEKLFIDLLQRANHSYENSAKVAYRFIMEGAGAHIAEPANIVKNWRLDKEWMPHGDGTGRQWRTSVAILEAGKKL